MIVLPIMCYNQIQVIVGAMLAQAYRRRIEAASAAAPHTTE
jgi:sodium/bile acid cotransporter 7